MAQNDVSTVRIVGRYQGQNIVNTLHYKHSEQAAPETEVLEELIDMVDTAISSLWVARHIATYTLVGYKAFRKTGVAKTPAFKAIGTEGSVVGEEVPSPMCRTITLYTADAKFRRRGRIMLSGSAHNMFNETDGAVTTTEVAALNTLGAAFLATLSGLPGSFDLCIPAAGADVVQTITDHKARVTPSCVTTRRVRQFLVG